MFGSEVEVFDTSTLAEKPWEFRGFSEGDGVEIHSAHQSSDEAWEEALKTYLHHWVRNPPAEFAGRFKNIRT